MRNVVVVEMSPETKVDITRLERHFYTTSSCGVCGKASLAALALPGDAAPIEDLVTVSAETICRLPELLRQAQSVFDQTGGIHGAALFNPDGNLIGIREDVGRHNAVDKLIGAEVRQGRVPLSGTILQLSGRASFELLQKALMAKIPIVAAVGAPSSLAVDLARTYGITLIGFVRGNRFNLYSGEHRLRV